MTSVTPAPTDADRFPIWSIYPTYFRVILKRRKKNKIHQPIHSNAPNIITVHLSNWTTFHTVGINKHKSSQAL